jgi:hypothetical protein
LWSVRLAGILSRLMTLGSTTLVLRLRGRLRDGRS